MCDTPSKYAWQRDYFQQEESRQDAEDYREDIPDSVVHVIIRDVDIPCTILAGELYPTCALQIVVDAVTAQVLEGIRDLEAGVSEAGRAALALAINQRPLFGAPVVIKVVVSGGGVQ